MDNYIFQTYHQRENVITANFLFFLKNVRRFSEKTYNDFLFKVMQIDNDAIDFDNNPLVVSFRNQAGKNGVSGIPDAAISMPSLKVLVEAKGNGAIFRKEQFEKHIQHFENEEFQLYITLDVKEITSADQKLIEELIEKKDKPIIHRHLRYQDVVSIIKTLAEESTNSDLKLLINEYENYLKEERLIDDFDYIMKMVLAGASLNENLKHSFYFHPSDKKGYSFKKVKYLGLYNQKAIRAVGDVEKVVKREIHDGKIEYEVVYPENSDFSNEEAISLEEKINKTVEVNGWKTVKEQPHYFYLIKEQFYSTNFIKNSPRGAMGVKHFNLKEILDIKEESLPEIAEIAALLNNKEWL